MATGRIRTLRGEEAAGRIDVDVEGDLHVRCDPGLAAEALAEVLKNALHFSPPGETVRMRAVSAPPDRVRYEIEDRGQGIAEYILETAIDGVLPESANEDSGVRHRAWPADGEGDRRPPCRPFRHHVGAGTWRRGVSQLSVGVATEREIIRSL